jgi:hypothetical protein
VIGVVRGLGVIGLTAGLLALGACSSSSAPPPPIGIVADSGFRPTPNGLPFANYGNQLADGTLPTNLTAAEMQRLFGDVVCADAASGRCDLIPEAQAWLESTNQMMAGGHCYGFSIAADLIWQGKLDPTTFGATSPTGLDDNNAELQRSLAYGWAMQLLQSVQSSEIDGTPDQILDKLREVLKPHPSETYTVSLFKPDFTGGHAVTPYAVENKGNGLWNVRIYDNNWPGQTRAIAIDTKADTWTYDAAINPSDPGSVYTGNAETKSLSLFPSSPGLGTQPCPFCGKEPSAVPAAGAVVAGKTEEVTLLGSDTHHANLIITASNGRHMGYVDGKLIEQIHGARDRPVISGDWTNNIEPDFFLPASGPYTITIDGTTLTSPDTETLRIIGPSYDVSVDNIPVRPGDKDTLVVGTDATKVSYTSSRTESPTLELGVSDTRADYAFTLSGVSDQPGSTIGLSLPTEGGTLTMDNVGSPGTSTVTVKMTRETEAGVQVFTHDAIPLVGGDTAQLQFGHWTSTDQGIPFVTIHNGRQSMLLLSDQGAGE